MPYWFRSTVPPRPLQQCLEQGFMGNHQSISGYTEQEAEYTAGGGALFSLENKSESALPAATSLMQTNCKGRITFF